MLPLYRSLLCLYPPAYRCEYGDEMLEVLSEVDAEIRKQSGPARMFSRAREAGGLLSGALREHFRSITGSDNMLSRGRFAMRSEFRFPRATVGLMLVILAAVMFTIEKAKAISASLPHANPPVGPIRPEQFTIVETLLFAWLWGVVAGAIGWAILYALHRSGVQQLSAMNPSVGQRPGK